MTIFGSIEFPRAYYLCPGCGKGCFPSDRHLHADFDVSPGAAELIVQAGVVDSFGEAAVKLLPRLANLKVSESTVQRVTEGVGNDVSAMLAAGETIGESQPWDWYQDNDGKTVAYIEADATGMPMQGPKGSIAPGKMMHVGAILNPPPRDWKGKKRPETQARYATVLTTTALLGVPLRTHAAQVGLDRAERWIALSDGASGLEDFLRVNFPRVEAVILDSRHVEEHLSDFAKLLWAGDEAKAKETTEGWKKEMHEGGGGKLLERLRGLPEPTGAAANDELQNLLGYVENNIHRMDYPKYLEKGWYIGSGAIESACKLVINRRQKGAGMRWGDQGAIGTAAARAMYRSEPIQWDAYWRHRVLV